MSREIKFRAWVPQLESYGEVLNIHFSEEGLPEIIEVFINGSNHHLNAFEVVFEQYVGLKDKNGKEICEGDIVKYLSYRKEYIGQIMFDFVDDSEGYYVEKHYGWGIRRDNYNSSLGDYADDNMKCELVEVIGNIHENKELLGDEE